MMESSHAASDFEVFNVLAYEFAVDNPRSFDGKVRRMLTRKRLGTYDPERTKTLRELKNSLQEEFRHPQASKFYVGSSSETSSIADFDQGRLSAYIVEKVPGMTLENAGRIASLAIYLYYLR